MARVAIVTDTASDLSAEMAADARIVVVPLIVTFGSESFRAGTDLSTDEFWARMVAPNAPFPKTAAASAGDFVEAFNSAFAGGAEAIVCVNVGSRLSATYQSALNARNLLPNREIHVVDSRSASMGQGLLALAGADLAAAGEPGAAIARTLERRAADIEVYLGLDTLEYLRRGGRISGPQAAIGGLLSVKPIITIRDGVVETAERVRTRTRARARMIELLAARPAERLAILYAMTHDHEAFRDEVVARLPRRISADRVAVLPIGPSIGPHLGPGCLGGAVLREPAA